MVKVGGGGGGGGGWGVQMSVVSFKKFWPFVSSQLNDY